MDRPMARRGIDLIESSSKRRRQRKSKQHRKRKSSILGLDAKVSTSVIQGRKKTLPGLMKPHHPSSRGPVSSSCQRTNFCPKPTVINSCRSRKCLRRSRSRDSFTAGGRCRTCSHRHRGPVYTLRTKPESGTTQSCQQKSSITNIINTLNLPNRHNKTH